mmetsp:Transcript_11287/g.23102  ORF Transcript_11287/g.23102 Transcript_11287/m.23102 type:complete len:542 (-) Transcript_11287:480-2105(-)
MADSTVSTSSSAGGSVGGRTTPVLTKQQQIRRVRKAPRATIGNNRRRTFSVGGMAFSCWQYDRLWDAILDGIQSFVEIIVYLLGPLLIVVALGITSILAYTFFHVMLPMMWEKYENYDPNLRLVLISLHCTWVVFLLVNVLFNYFMCVTTRNAGKNYDRAVRELATVTGFIFPETPVQQESWRQEYEDKMTLRIRRRREREMDRQQELQDRIDKTYKQQPAAVSTRSDGSNGGGNHDALPDVESGVDPLQTSSSATTNNMTHRKAAQSSSASPKKTASAPPSTTVRRWMLMGPYEWGYCNNSKQPKPPRSHYDHVTKRLVMNLDHYCPWMFNSIGYFNYRYFVNFLIYIFMGMSYGALLTCQSFYLLQTKLYKEQRSMEARLHSTTVPRLHPMLPHRDERMLVQLAFMLCAAVGLAIMILGGFHVYLVLTAQTTIEFHGNWSKHRKAKKANKKYRNPYDEGWRKNWKRVYGDRPMLLALLPSFREPEYLPVPIPGKDTRRRSQSNKKDFDDGYDENQLLLQEGGEDRGMKHTPLLPGNQAV